MTDKDGYGIEAAATAGTSVITAAGSTAYMIGRLASRNEWPSPMMNVIYGATGVNAKEVAAGQLLKGDYDMRGMLTCMVQNGVLIWWAMGGHSDTEAGGIYTHTIVPTTDGTQLRTFTFQHEESEISEEFQFAGCKVDSLVLSHDSNGPDMLMAKIEIMAMKATDPAFTLTNDPALPATANDDPYISLTRTWDYGSGNTSIDGLLNVEIAIINGLQPVYARSWDTGTYTGYWPWLLKEAPRKQYRITMAIHPQTIGRDLWDELLARSNTKELYFKWTRSANDYIECTATDCQVIKHEIVTDDTNKIKVVQVEIEPRALSFTVKDSINGTPHYGDA